MIAFRFNSRQRVIVCLLNLAAISCYFFVAKNYGLLANVDQLLTQSSDTVTYLDVAKWIAQQQTATAHLIIRPFFYPLLIASGQIIFGTLKSVWWLQAFLWIMTVNFIYFAVQLLTKRIWLALLFAGIFITNLSVIAITFHALAEMTALFLSSAAVFFYALAYRRQTQFSYPQLAIQLFLVSLLTVTKPVFLLPLVGLFVFALALHFRALRAVGMLVLACAPVCLQIGLVHHLYGEWTVSKISALTVKDYLLVRDYAAVEGITVANEQVYSYVKSQVANYQTSDALKYFATHFASTLTVFFGNLKDSNLLTGSGTSGGSMDLYQFTKTTNYGYFGLHCLLALLTLFGVFVLKQKLLPIWGLLIIGYFIIFSSGLSFWQGDRLVLTALPFWLTAYAFITDQYIILLASSRATTATQQHKTKQPLARK